MGCEFADGDRFHSPAAVAKMHDGVPLTDDDRWPWLDAIGAWIDQEDGGGQVGRGGLLGAEAQLPAAAARRAARAADVLPGRRHDADEARLTTRRGHFFPEKLLDSQFATLELPEPSEGVTLVPATGTPDQTADEILRDLGRGPRPADQPGGRPSSAMTWSSGRPRQAR